MARSGGDALKIQENVFRGHRERVFDGNWPPLEHGGERESVKADRFGGDVSWISQIPQCVVFTPSIDEFKDPLAYISSISPLASKYGICKIIPPILPSVPAGRVLMKEKSGFKFSTRVQPMSLSDWDSDNNKVTFLTSAQRYTFSEFEKMANKFHSRRFSTAAVQPPLFVEAEFWKEMLAGNSDHIQYASDVDGSAFSSSPADPLASSNWNLKIVSSLPKSILRLLETIIPGVTEPMLYIGMLFSMFAWHVEDHYLYSINYHHCGAPKTWYGVPGEAAQRFESVVKEEIYAEKLLSEHGQGAAYDLLIGKTTMFPPNILVKHGVPVYKAVQAPGEYVLTFPRSYHAGFSHGFNCGEAVNFAMADWFPFGAAACRRYSLLNRMPLLPHEELLWKEAQGLDASDNEKKQNAESLMQMPVKSAFVQLMAFQHKVRWLLKERGAAIYTSLAAPINIPCSLCKHMCYVSFLTCKCFPEPTCLNHAQEMRKCQCGKERQVFLHRDIKKMDAVALRFQTVVSPLPVVDDGMVFDSALLEEDFLDGEEYSGYVPFDNIDAPDLESPIIFGSSVVTTNSDADADAKKSVDTCVNKAPKPGVAVRSMPSKRTNERNRLSLCFKKEPKDVKELNSQNVEQGEVAKQQHVVKVWRASSGESALLLRDIISELHISGSVEEIKRRWRTEVSNLHFVCVNDNDTNHSALTYKACQRLKRMLSPSQAEELEGLFRRDPANQSTDSSVLGKREINKADGHREKGCSRKRPCQDSGLLTFPAGRPRSQSLPAEQSFCLSSTSDSQADQDFVATDCQADRGIKTNRSHCSAADSNTRHQLGRWDGTRPSVDSVKGAAGLDADRDRPRKVFPRFKVKGPSLPPFRGAEGSGENILVSRGSTHADGLRRSVESSSYSRFEHSCKDYSQAHRSQRTR
ncbi:lysine-specific demethylase JMJ706 isoform X1 [Selaginella moellendorffii]|uniref:lysine-specific demethylase JMJ706 isoform X1 n=1 Tax=Selaginella moellendorffii TaxID=88036 RepID=UPI000D1CE0E5|nr:lysine-specific demethylase JMJ706 isoform X1 [Selaginella moellendorffii]|eukprot:XP_024524853.1 lysine-specific demethylase JMJ706 isoform X1 [Selaginella moellendorffii]